MNTLSLSVRIALGFPYDSIAVINRHPAFGMCALMRIISRLTQFGLGLRCP
ncbi:MAG: hypothetical protein GX545_06475 [Fibrobacter sp.]|nr:hypothetical protein [Fibrobacter sp.]